MIYIIAAAVFLAVAMLDLARGIDDTRPAQPWTPGQIATTTSSARKAVRKAARRPYRNPYRFEPYRQPRAAPAAAQPRRPGHPIADRGRT